MQLSPLQVPVACRYDDLVDDVLRFRHQHADAFVLVRHPQILFERGRDDVAGRIRHHHKLSGVRFDGWIAFLAAPDGRLQAAADLQQHGATSIDREEPASGPCLPIARAILCE